MQLSELHRRDVNRVTDAILRRKRPVEANRVFEDSRTMLRWALARGDLDHDPTIGMKKPAETRIRERVLNDAEVNTLWNVLPKALARSNHCQRIIQLCLVTGQRVGEVAGMHRDELDFETRTWVLPGARTKNGHPHAVPLSDLALGIIIQALKSAGNSPFVFPADTGPLPAMAVARTIGRAQARFGIAHWTAHDLRRSAITGMARSVSRRLCWDMSRTIAPRRRQASRSASTHTTTTRARRGRRSNCGPRTLQILLKAAARYDRARRIT